MWSESMRSQVGYDFEITEETDEYVVVGEGFDTARACQKLLLASCICGAIVVALYPKLLWKEMHDASLVDRLFVGFMVAALIAWVPFGMPICAAVSVLYRKDKPSVSASEE